MTSLFVSGGPGYLIAHHPPGRSIRPYLTKLLTILKQQTDHELSLSLITSQTPCDYQKKAGRRAGFFITSPDGECQTTYC
ncbi:hypothetical protein Z648_21865 [Salmonella enterica subsp. enterica serovar Agona]|nr:hypothetical protein [Salmonella enterica subsp. enterica serovar Agona]EEK7644677.1 hypothetical protein [Salmonella enterica subsp. enterica serovar Agona]